MMKIDRIYKEHARAMFLYARQLGFDRDMALDAIHDVFCIMLEKPELVDKVDNMHYYLCKAIRNRLLNMLKEQLSAIDLPDETEDSNSVGEMFAEVVTIEDEIIRCEEEDAIKRKVRQLLDSLPSRRREVLFLRYIQELDYEPIANMMKIPVAACRKLHYKAMLQLRDGIEQNKL
ncbi:MAG: sigma-70 family RNA polymerase sigma factor [Tannerella sp.]|jgi:RNA polymerase sigma factor (sigma-70 family)|nr:sigma-70 family RNA polymerase sigma factor [Tannerella sp.]